MKGLAKRRHDRHRMVARAKRMMNTWASNDPTWVERAANRWADNMKKCSCEMCGNHRDACGPTTQELRFDQWKRDSD
jgi:hypothetical protein